MLVADEWDIGVGDAWYLTAGAVWPLTSGLLLAESYDADDDSQYMYGLLGATAGLTLATLSVALSDINEGGAVLAHSGGTFGLLLGGVGQLIYEGRTDVTPTRGMGFGTAIGVIAGGALATLWKPPASQVLLIDLGASLGALTGAAAASPVLFVDGEAEAWQNRVWLTSIAAGTAAGSLLGWWLTRGSAAESRALAPRLLPHVGVVGFDDAVRAPRPVLGAGLFGSW
jgi:predicted membrane protein